MCQALLTLSSVNLGLNPVQVGLRKSDGGGPPPRQVLVLSLFKSSSKEDTEFRAEK